MACSRSAVATAHLTTSPLVSLASPGAGPSTSRCPDEGRKWAWQNVVLFPEAAFGRPNCVGIAQPFDEDGHNPYCMRRWFKGSSRDMFDDTRSTCGSI